MENSVLCCLTLTPLKEYFVPKLKSMACKLEIVFTVRYEVKHLKKYTRCKRLYN